MADAEVSEATHLDTDSLSAYLREVGRTRALARAEEKVLLDRMGRGDRAARNLLITSHLKLVVSVCLGYRGHGLPFADLIAEGNLGLIRAARSFDSVQGRFAPYAEWWIRHAILCALKGIR